MNVNTFVQKNSWNIVVQIISVFLLLFNLYLTVKLLPFEFRIGAIEARISETNPLINDIPLIKQSQENSADTIREIRADVKEVNTNVREVNEKIDRLSERLFTTTK